VVGMSHGWSGELLLTEGLLLDLCKRMGSGRSELSSTAVKREKQGRVAADYYWRGSKWMGLTGWNDRRWLGTHAWSNIAAGEANCR
jgi:hypothetical protein